MIEIFINFYDLIHKCPDFRGLGDRSKESGIDQSSARQSSPLHHFYTLVQFLTITITNNFKNII